MHKIYRNEKCMPNDLDRVSQAGQHVPLSPLPPWFPAFSLLPQSPLNLWGFIIFFGPQCLHGLLCSWVYLVLVLWVSCDSAFFSTSSIFWVSWVSCTSSFFYTFSVSCASMFSCTLLVSSVFLVFLGMLGLLNFFMLEWVA